MQKQGKGRKSLIIGIVAAVVILAAVLVLLLTQCTGGQSGATTAPSTTAGTDEVPTYELYWNLDRAEYDGKSEAGMSSRMPESDGYFHVRFMLDGEEVTLKVQDRKVINKLDVMDLMGLEFDENGIVTGVIAIEEMPLQKVAWQFYVQSAGGKLIKANSSETFGGMEIQLEGTENTGVYDMTGKSGPVGCAATPIEYDRIYAVQNLAGEVTHVFIYERINYMISHEGECQHCEKTVTWYEWTREDKLPTTSGHYQLMNDISLDKQQSMSQDDQKICLDLNGKRVDGKSGNRIYSLHNPGSSLAIMDTSEGETGVLAAHGTGNAQGLVVWVRYGQFHLYSGTLDGSDATTKYYGTTVTVPKNAYFYMHGGTIIGGTAAYNKSTTTGAYTRGYGGAMYVGGKFVMNDGEIRDGFAQAVTYKKAGATSTTTTRGYGGNIFVGDKGEVELLGGVIKNGKAGSAGGNLYLDGTATVTLDGTKIQGGLITGKGKNGGSVYIGSKASLVMKSGSISGGTSYNGGGNMYINGKFTMSGGGIWGGKVCNYTTKKVNEASTNYNIFLVNGTFKMYGGRIYGGVGVTDTSSTDNKTAYVGLATYATIKSDEENTTNLTLNTGSKINCRVDTLRDSASIGINTGRGLFTAPTLEANKDKFFSDVEGAEVIYTEDGLFLGREKCVCGKETHINGCDGTKYLWACWISGSSLPKTNGNYFLTKNVTTTGQTIVTKGHTVRLDLNGFNGTYKVAATSSDGFRLYRSAFQSLLVITDTTDKPGALRTVMPKEADVLATVQAKLESGEYDQAKADKIIAGQKTGNFGQILWARGGDIVVHNGIIDGSSLNGTTYGLTICVGANTASEDGGVTRKGSFTMYGGTIKGATGATSKGYGCSLYGSSNSVITLHGGVIEDGKSTGASGGNVYVLGQFTMDGGIIRNGKAYSSGGNLVVEGEKAVATITGNAQILNGEAGDPTLEKDIGRGGNIRVVTKGAQLILSGDALVSGGKVYRSASDKAGYGGNISVNTGTTMVMTGGTVENGVSQHRAGNIDVCGVLNISGGTITGGKAKYGGNIYVLNGERELNMTGGTIEKGHAIYTGGNIQALGPVNITGGVVAEGKAALESGAPSSSNNGGNIYACSELNIGGEAVIRDGYSGYNGGNITLYVDDSLKGNAVISGKAQILNGVADGQLKEEFDGGYGGSIRANNGTTLTVKDEALIAGGQAIGGKYVNGKGGGGQGGNLYLANATVNLLGGTIENGTATGGGGNIGASAATGTLILDGVIVRNGDTGTSYGGNIRVRGNGLGLLEIKGNTQILNGKANYGGAIALDGSKLTTVKVSGNAKIEGSEANLGGAVYVAKNVDFTITDNAQIIGGKTVTGDGFGGAVYLSADASFAMGGKAQIVGGQALAGGAVYLKDEIKFSMADEAVITGGQAEVGGTVYLKDKIEFSMADKAVITGGDVGDSGNGPAVYIDTNSSFAMTGNAVIDGTESVGKRGGAVYMNGATSSFTMDGYSKLIGGTNKALTNGGAGYLRGTVTIGGNAQIVPGPNVKYAGGIYFYTGTLTLKDNATIDASGIKVTNGSAVYAYQKTATVKVQDKAVIRGGETTGSGATIFMENGSALEIAGGEIYGGKTVKSGAAIYTTGKITMSGGAVYGGEAGGNGGAIYTTGKVTMTGGTVYGGQAAFGGAMYVYNGASMTMSDGSIVGGTATKSGGALALEANANTVSFTMTGGSIVDGSASASGGNVWIYANKADKPVTASFSNATISGGEAKSHGGNIYITAVSSSTAPHTVALSNTTISDGVAKTGLAGNLYVKYADVTMDGGSFTGGINGIEYPSSPDDLNGGSIYLYTGATFTMNSGSITGGKTVNTAGNVYVGVGSVFTMNGGSISGGAKINKAGEVTSTTATNLNVYVVSAEMIMNGGSIDGHVAMYNKAKLTVSGDATMASADADAQELYLNGTTEPITISGTLTADRVAKIRFKTGTTQVFSGETTADNVARFTAYNADETVFHNSDKKLEVGKLQCICGFVGGKHIGDCDSTEYQWSAWTETDSLPTTTGFWYLTGNVQTVGNNRVDDEQNIVLDINGYTVKGTDSDARIYALRYSSVNSKNVTLTLTDTYQGTDRTGLIQGWKENGKTESENGGIVWLASDNDKLNLYHITLDASKNAPNGSKYGLAVSMSGAGNELNVFDSVILGGNAGKGDAVSISSLVNDAKIRLEGDVTIGGIEGSAIYMGGEGNLIDVSKLSSVSAPIIVEGTGFFTQGWDEENLKVEDYFESVAEDKFLEELNGELGLWPYRCMCGMPEGKHVEGFCDETKYVWHPWIDAEGKPITNKIPTTTGNYYLTDHVSGAYSTVITEQDIKLDLNGYNITQSKNRLYSTLNNDDPDAKFDLVLTNTAAEDESVIKVTGSGDQGRIVWLRGYNKTLKVYNLTVDTTEATTAVHGVAFSMNAYESDKGAYMGIFNTVFNGPTATDSGNGSILSISKGNKCELELQDVTINGGYGYKTDGTVGDNQKGGAILHYYGHLSMKNVTIQNAQSGNKGGAIYVGGTAKVTMTGLISIEGKDKDGNACGIYTNGGTIDVADLTEGSQIGICGKAGVISANDYTSDDADLTYLSAENSEQYLAIRDGKLNLLGKECMCGMPDGKHVAGFCDEKLRAWQPWSGNTAPTKTGNYYLTGDLTVSETVSLGAEAAEIIIDLNGNDIIVASQGSTADGHIYDTEGGNGKVKIVLTNRASDDAAVKVEGAGGVGRVVHFTTNDCELSAYNVDVDLSAAATTEDKRKDGLIAYVDGSGNKVSFYDVNITGGTTYSFGQALFINNGNSAVLTRCEISGCKTSGRGGFAYVRGTMTLNNCTIQNGGSTNSFAGAVYLYGTNATKRAKLIVNGGSFQNCSAANGGAIDLQKYADVELNGVSFSGNNVTTNGGDVAVHDGCTATIKDCTFENSGAKTGGAILVGEGGSVTLTDCQFTGCSATSTGGAVFIGKGSDATLNNCTFEKCNAQYGGAVYLESDDAASPAKLVMTGGSIKSCTSTSPGGAINSNKHGDVELTNVSIEDCEGSSGGAIAMYTGSSVQLTNCTIKECSANKSYGGAIYVNSSNAAAPVKLTMTGGTIDGCSSGSYGGAIVAGIPDNTVTYTEVELTNVTIDGCEAVKRAGGIHVSNGSKLVADGCTIKNCTVTGTSRGGGLYSFMGNVTLLDTTIENNATKDVSPLSGGIHLYECSITLGGKIVVKGNTAGSKASDIYIQDATRINTVADRPLTSDSEIGVYGDSSDAKVLSETLPYSVKDCFFSNKSDHQVIHDGSNLRLVAASEHWHCVCAGQPTNDPNHVCKDIQFTEVTELKVGVLAAGNYYLADSMTVTGTTTANSAVEIGTGSTVICLAGHELKGNDTQRLLYLGSSNTLTLTTCGRDAGGNPVGTLYNASEKEGNIVGAYNSSVLNMYNVTMDASKSVYSSKCWGNAINLKGTFNMYSGTIIGSSDTSNVSENGAVGVNEGATMNMYGGTIRDSAASDICGNIGISGTLNMMGGTITGGKVGSSGASSNKANIRVSASGVLNMTGGVIDGHAYAGTAGATVKLSGDAKILHTGNRGLWVIPGNTNLYIGDLTDKAQLEIIVRDKDGNVTYGVFAKAMENFTILDQDVSRITVTGTDGVKSGNVILNSDNALEVEPLN